MWSAVTSFAMIRTLRSNLRVLASSSAEAERVTGVAVTLLVTLTVALLLTRLDRLFVILLVMLPVALVITLLDVLFVTLLVMLLVIQLSTWYPAPMSRSAVPARTRRDGNRREKYRILCAPLCKDIDSRKEGCIMTMGRCQSNECVIVS